MDTEKRDPLVLTGGTGVFDVWWLGGRLSTKVSGEQTGGRFANLVFTDPRGTAAPLHTHEDATETFHILEGEVTLFLDDEEVVLGPGDFALVPPGVTHSYLVRSERAQFAVVIEPAGTEGFFAELGVPVVPGEPPPAPVPPDPEEFARRAKQYGINIVGPPPSLT